MRRYAPAFWLALGVLVVVLLPRVVSDFREFQLAYVGVYFIATQIGRASCRERV